MTPNYDATIFDLGGTLLAIEDDEIATDGQGRVRLLPGLNGTLKALAGQPVFVVTNQQGVARGSLTEANTRGFIEQLDAAADGIVSDYRISMHWADAGCPCRKPRPGMLLDLAEAARIGHFVWAEAFFSAGARA